jgi:hypothetical protein
MLHILGTTQGDFDQHMTVHFEHICPHCDYKSRTEGRLKRHIKDFHTEDPDGGYNRTMPGRPKVFRCKQCEYSTTDKVSYIFCLVYFYLKFLVRCLEKSIEPCEFNFTKLVIIS